MIRGVGPYSTLFTPKAGSLFHAEFQIGERRVGQEHLFYELSLERHVPDTHLARSRRRCR
jgi:hypothetical protein